MEYESANGDEQRTATTKAQNDSNLGAEPSRLFPHRSAGFVSIRVQVTQEHPKFGVHIPWGLGLSANVHASLALVRPPLDEAAI